MGKIKTILTVALSLMLTVAFTPAFSFAGISGSTQNTDNHLVKSQSVATAYADENPDGLDEVTTGDDDEETAPIPGTIVKVNYSGVQNQATAYGLLAKVNCGFARGYPAKVTWNSDLEKYLMNRVAEMALYANEDYHPDGTDANEDFASDDNSNTYHDFYFYNETTLAKAYTALKDDLAEDPAADDPDAGSTGSDTSDDEVTADDYAKSMAAAEFVTASGEHYWCICLTNVAATSQTNVGTDSKASISLNAGLKLLKLTISFSSPDKFYLGDSMNVRMVNKNTVDGNKLTLTSPDMTVGSSFKRVEINGNTIKAVHVGGESIYITLGETKISKGLQVISGSPTVTVKYRLGKITIKWSSVPGATNYHLAVLQDNAIIYKTTTTKKSVSLKRGKGSYEVCVKAYIKKNSGSKWYPVTVKNVKFK